MAERRTFTVVIYEDTGEVKEVIGPESVKVTSGRLTEHPIKGPITKIVVPFEFVMSATGQWCVHTPDCRLYCRG